VFLIITYISTITINGVNVIIVLVGFLRIWISRDVRLKARKDFYFTPEVETTAIKNALYQGTTFEYEALG
jgi:hypothetical protein